MSPRQLSDAAGTVLREARNCASTVFSGVRNLLVAVLTAEIEISLWNQTIVIKARNGLAIVAAVIIVWLVLHA